MATPVQIILNPEHFEEVREAAGGGPRKDFFAGRDDAYLSHRSTLLTRLDRIAETLEGQPQGAIGVLKVVLRREAWAKSHRPLKALFKRDRVRLIGGGDLGEMYFDVRPSILRAIRSEAANTENETRYRTDRKTGKIFADPSPARSEVGAIDRIELYGPEDKRKFSVEEALSWLSNPMTGGAYHVELFDIPPPHSQWDAIDPDRRRLFSSFVDGLETLGHGATVQRLEIGRQDRKVVGLRLEQSTASPILMLQAPMDRLRERRLAPFDRDVSRHRELLHFLDHHPLVRKVELPPLMTRTIIDEKQSARAAAQSTSTEGAPVEILARDSKRTYPRLGVIDGGIGGALTDWVIGKWELLDASHLSLEHGTFIAGLAVVGNAINGPDVCAEPDGTEIVDIAIFPDEAQPNAFEEYFPAGISDFFDEIENAVADARARHGTRIFNLSLNVQQACAPDVYGSHAARLDSIAERHGVLFFVSAGNTSPQHVRSEWPADEKTALAILAAARNDGLLMPAESVRNVSVAALNPPPMTNCLPHAPARYSRRGPGLRAGVKPDLAHFGGTGSPQSPLGHGLYSIKPIGTKCDGCGTSYAAPLVAKTAAVLDHSIEGEVSRETLIALLIHGARVPDLLTSKSLSGIGRDLVGFGRPASARELLEADDHQITLVFASRLRRDQQISFRFAWPPSLVTEEGKCRGSAKLTLVSTPPTDTRFGSEFVRVNIDAALQQEDFDRSGKPAWKGRLDPIYLPGKADAPIYESEQIEHGLKWSPVKVFAKSFPNGKGKSSNWRMFVKYLTRAGEDMPEEGVPFTAILTISDPDREAPVFADMRLMLRGLGVQIEDIRTAARVTTRV